MNRHPAHQMAGTVEMAAAELRGYMDPGDPFPWEPTEDDHRDLLPRLDRAISALAVGIRGIAQATGDQYAQRQLTDSYHSLVGQVPASGWPCPNSMMSRTTSPVRNWKRRRMPQPWQPPASRSP